MGIFVIITGKLMFLYITIDALLFDVYYPLFKWLVTIIYIFMGVQFLLLWLLGEYIGRIFEQQKNRPLYIIDEKINMD
jgi:polyisoprenyl-phosphate glycosyltransferase